MLLALTSLWQAGNDVIVAGEGVSANPQIGTGLVLIATGAGGGISKRRRRKPRRLEHYWVPRPMPVPLPINVECTGEGVAARPRIGTGNVLIEVDFSDEELIALIMAAGEPEIPVRRLARAVQLAYSRDALELVAD